MLKKFKPVPTESPISSIGNRQHMLTGRRLGAVPVRLVASHWPQPGYGSVQPEDTNAVGSMESWRLLLKQLSLLVGNEGSAAILFHSIGQLGLQYPALQTLSPQHSWPEQLATVQNTLQQLPHSTAAFARQSLWFRGCQLMTKLLGLSLSRRLLHKVAAEQSSY